MIVTSLKKPRFWYYLIMALFGALYLTMAIANHYFFRTFTFDYGVFNNDYWNLAHFHLGGDPLYYGGSHADVNTLKIHFTAILIYLLPFYWLLNWLTGTYTLLILQELIVILAGWAVYKLIVQKTQNGWLGVLALLYYFLLQGHYAAFALDFNEAIVCASLIPLFLYAFETNRLKIAGVMFVLCLFGREDMPLYFIFILLTLILWHRKEMRLVRLCLYGIAISIIYFALVFGIFIPLTHSHDNQYYLFEYSALGKTPWTALGSMITDPFHALRLLFVNQTGDISNNWIKAEFYLVFLASGGFFALYRPRYLIWFIPMIAQKMFNDDVIRWGIEAYYSIFIVTLLPISVFLAINDIYHTSSSRIKSGIAACLLAGMVTYFVENEYVHAINWINTEKETVFNPKFFDVGFNAGQIHRLLKEIPPDAAVSASQKLTPQLAQRSRIYQYPYRYDATYIALFSFPDYYEIPQISYWDSVSRILYSPEWNMVGYSYPFMLFKKEPNKLNHADFISCRKPAVQDDSLSHYLSLIPMRILIISDSSMLLDKADYQERKVTGFSCDCETFSADGKSPIGSDGQPFPSDGIKSGKAHRGKYSLLLTPDKQYGLNRQFTGLKAGEILKVTVWRNNPAGKGFIVICNNDNSVYYTSSRAIKYDSNGWQKLELTVAVPYRCPELKSYMWSGGKDSIYFDDLNVELFSRRK